MYRIKPDNSPPHGWWVQKRYFGFLWITITWRNYLHDAREYIKEHMEVREREIVYVFKD
jgi:hypothetical protein